MSRKREWTRTVLGILQHDLSVVALVVSLVVAGVGVFALVQRGASESNGVSPSSVALEAPDDAQPIDGELRALDPLDPVLAEPERAPALAADVLAAEPETQSFEGSLASGETLSQALRQDGVSGDIVYAITRAMGKLYDFRKARPGHSYRLTLDSDGELTEFRYVTSPIESYSVSRDGEAFMSRREEPPTRTEVARLAGVVTSNLHEAVKSLGESPQLAVDLADIFAWDIDFSRSVRFGDEIRVLYERLYRTDAAGEDHYVGPGRILAARYLGAAGDHAAVYFESGQGRGGYYRPDGTSVERNFLMVPVRNSRVASAFSNSRLHPILRIWRPHHGIDYAAPEGTPIWAVADGTVIHRDRAGGFGNLVKIRHADGYVSYYGHLSRFGSGMAVGQKVRQKQVIGYVGHTGLATGPHVCFRMSKDGRFVDPARLRIPGGPPLSTAHRQVFASSRDVLLARLDAATPLLETDEAL
jgi:murein DD-endopeptidase MepM/ murein hydrolase activator NlpD